MSPSILLIIPQEFRGTPRRWYSDLLQLAAADTSARAQVQFWEKQKTIKMESDCCCSNYAGRKKESSFVPPLILKDLLAKIHQEIHHYLRNVTYPRPSITENIMESCIWGRVHGHIPSTFLTLSSQHLYTSLLRPFNFHSNSFMPLYLFKQKCSCPLPTKGRHRHECQNHLFDIG